MSSSSSEDDWVKPRGHGDHLTTAEISFIMEECRKQTPARVVAERLKCSTRTVDKYYAQFRGAIPKMRSTCVSVPTATAPSDGIRTESFTYHWRSTNKPVPAPHAIPSLTKARLMAGR